MNVGKIFESDFKKSVPTYCVLQRLADQPQSFSKRSDTKFSLKNPFDFLLFDCKRRNLWAIECKTTKYKSLSVAFNDNENKMIKYHQIKSLSKIAEHENVIAGFLINFRSDDIERTYFQNINDFNSMIHSLNKSSFNELDLLTNNAIKVVGEKKKVHYKWDIDTLLKSAEV